MPGEFVVSVLSGNEEVYLVINAVRIVRGALFSNRRDFFPVMAILNRFFMSLLGDTTK